MKKKVLLFITVVLCLTLLSTTAFAVTLTDYKVIGGPSQFVAYGYALGDGYYVLNLTSLNLNGQSKVTFRPYTVDANDNFTVAAAAAQNFTATANTTPSYYSSYNTVMALKASIPSTSLYDYAQVSLTWAP